MMIHEFSTEQMMDLMDIATDALEEIAALGGVEGKIALHALEEIGTKTEELMRTEK